MEDLARCHLHRDREAVGQCQVCLEYFCDACLAEQGTSVFCGEHDELVRTHQWSCLMQVVSTAETPEAGIKLYQFKEDLWRLYKIPSFIKTTYELQEDSDFIESHVSLMVVDDKVQEAKELLQE